MNTTQLNMTAVEARRAELQAHADDLRRARRELGAEAGRTAGRRRLGRLIARPRTA